jgi:hypothetical protein
MRVPSATSKSYALVRGVGAPFTNQVEWKILASVHEIIYVYPNSRSNSVRFLSELLFMKSRGVELWLLATLNPVHKRPVGCSKIQEISRHYFYYSRKH